MGQVLRVAEFRVVWAAELASIVGDQLARVALAVLVFGRTGSAAWAAATYALTFLPAIVGGVALSGLADRFRRREVMVGADVLRAGLVAAMAIPVLPLWALCGLLVLVVLLGSPHSAAQGALLPEILRGERYEQGLAVRQITSQVGQLVGFGTGGLLVALLSPQSALLLDAATFAVSAVLVRWGVADRPRPGRVSTGRPAGGLRGVGQGVRAIAVDPHRRVLVLLAWLVGCYVVPEALAVPYAADLGSGPAVVGLLMAAGPLGSVLGAWSFTRFVPAATRPRLIGVLAVAAGLPLVTVAAHPGLALSLVLWATSGMCSTAYLLQTQASFVRATPEVGRGRAIGVAASGTIAAQGVAVLAGGLLADVWTPAAAVAVAGGVGSLLSLAGAVAWHRVCRGERRAAASAASEAGVVL